MIHYFVSACLLGHKVRYDDQDCHLAALLDQLIPPNISVSVLKSAEV